MPYIKPERRQSLKPIFVCPETAGELNYVVTQLCRQYIHNTGLRYENINAVVGALECAKQEFYRRVAVPYEDAKIRENGDVYES